MSWLDDWADDESRRIKGEQAERDRERRRKEDISEQGSWFWNSLTGWMQKGAEKINATPTLHDKVGSHCSPTILALARMRLIEPHEATYLFPQSF